MKYPQNQCSHCLVAIGRGLQRTIFIADVYRDNVMIDALMSDGHAEVTCENMKVSKIDEKRKIVKCQERMSSDGF